MRRAFQLLAEVGMRDGDQQPYPLGTGRPLRFTIPYSVAADIMSARAVVTGLPRVRCGTIRLRRRPRFSQPEVMQVKDLPPAEA